MGGGGGTMRDSPSAVWFSISCSMDGGCVAPRAGVGLWGLFAGPVVQAGRGVTRGITRAVTCWLWCHSSWIGVRGNEPGGMLCYESPLQWYRLTYNYSPQLQPYIELYAWQSSAPIYTALLWQKEASDIPSKSELLMFSYFYLVCSSSWPNFMNKQLILLRDAR